MKSLLFVVCVGAAACGGPGAEGTTTPKGGGPTGTKTAAAGDVMLEIPLIELKGVIFEPEALGRPGMPLYNPRQKVSLATQKKKFGAAKDPTIKQAEAAILVTLLYNESKSKSGDDAKKLIEEARQVLRVAAAAAGAGKVDEVTQRLLGSYEIMAEDFAAAEVAWRALVDSKSKDAIKEQAYNKAWLVHSLLRQYKNAEALAVVKGDKVSKEQPEHAYATAWAKWRAGDDAGAWEAIVAAAKGWGNNAGKEALQRDLLLFAGRSRIPFTEVAPKLYAVFNAKVPADQYAVVAKLGLQAYQFAGKWSEGVASLEEALKLAGATVPANDKVAIKYYQADFSVRLDQPDAAARYAKDAIAALPPCTKCSEKEKQDVVVGIYGIARLFHLLYATANDVRYYQPAHDLYVETIGLIKEQATRDQAKNDLQVLEKTLKNTKAGTGTHEKQAIGVLLGRHNQEVLACYEESLAADPKLAGKLVVNLESDATGEIKGASSEPKAGAAGMSAVAACVVAHAKTWKLPKRGMAGNTRIALSYKLEKK